MSDTMGSGSPSDGNVTVVTNVATQGPGGLIDVSGMTFDELSATIGVVDLGRALDYILDSGENGTGYHGFSNSI